MGRVQLFGTMSRLSWKGGPHVESGPAGGTSLDFQELQAVDTAMQGSPR